MSPRAVLALLLAVAAPAASISVVHDTAPRLALREPVPTASSGRGSTAASSLRNQKKAGAATDTTWPEGTQRIRFENLEGMVLIEMTLRGTGGRDTTGLFVLDTGAGFLALDHDLATGLGIADSARGPRTDAVDLAS